MSSVLVSPAWADITNEVLNERIAIECRRQNLGHEEELRLRQAYDLAREEFSTMFERRLFQLSRLIAPNDCGRYRDRNARGIPRTVDIPHLMDDWIQRFDTEIRVAVLGETTPKRAREFLIKEFIDIRPFNYGTERIAWLLRVWLFQEWADPKELPNYYIHWN